MKEKPKAGELTRNYVDDPNLPPPIDIKVDTSKFMPESTETRVEVDPDNGTEVTYRKDGSIKKRVLGDGTEEYFYENGNIKGKFSPDGIGEYYSEDVYGRLTKRTFPDGSMDSFDWDGTWLGRFDKEGKEIQLYPPEPELAAVAEPAPVAQPPVSPEPVVTTVVESEIQIAEREKTKAIAKLRETIANAQRIIEEETNGVVAVARRKRIEELRTKLEEEKPTDVQKADKKEEKTGEITAREASLLQLRTELNGISKLKSKKRKGLETAIFRLEKDIIFLKDKKQNPLKWSLIDNLHSTNFRVLFDSDRKNVSLEEIDRIMGETGSELKFWNPQNIIKERDEAVSFSSNGFYLKLKNKEEVQGTEGIKVYDPKARYDLVAPDGLVLDVNVNYQTGKDLLTEKAREYQTQQLDKFNEQIELKELESIATIEEKKEFLERKRKERIKNIKEVKEDIEYNTGRLTSEHEWAQEEAKETLEAINNSPLEFYTQRVEHFREAGDVWKSSAEAYQKIVDQINAINARYDALLANLEK